MPIPHHLQRKRCQDLLLLSGRQVQGQASRLLPLAKEHVTNLGVEFDSPPGKRASVAMHRGDHGKQQRIDGQVG